MEIKNVYLNTSRKWPSILFVFHDGHTRSFTVRADKQTAEQVLASIKSKLALGTLVVSDYFRELKPRAGLSDYVDRYIKARQDQVNLGNLSANTAETDYYALKAFLNAVGDVPLIKINRATVDQFVAWLRQNKSPRTKAPYSPTTINVYLNHIQSAMAQARKAGLVDDNPFLDYPRQTVRIKKRRYLTADEIDRIRDYLEKKNPWVLDAFNLNLWTGLRAQGIIDANINNLFSDGAPFLTVIEKGNKERDIPLPRAAMDIIERRKQWLADTELQLDILRKMFTPGKIPSYLERAQQGFLFFEIANKDTLSHVFSKARRVIDLPKDITWHSLRHSFATYYIERGGDVKTLKEILGHSKLNTTEIYAKTTRRKMAQNIDDYTTS